MGRFRKLGAEMFRCFKNTQGLAVLGLAAAAAVYLALWHGAHLAAIAPLLLVLACPLMHLFMHGGHHHKTPRPTDTTHPTQREN
ncbi:MAG: hypothetical protein FD162_3146 [Rhodobacteraceae bacterium]|nr:MAG: hypothetical protein FD162_3146 [Paracoccaceae bacterium]